MSKRKSKAEQIDWLREQLETSQTRVQQLVNERDHQRKRVADLEDQIAKVRTIIGPAPWSFIGGGGSGGVGQVRIYPGVNT